ncbi:MAG: amidohydrolase [Planctomycetes bacterium]|nr:amidohydrolase [Planctomycetota bacterium]
MILSSLARTALALAVLVPLAAAQEGAPARTPSGAQRSALASLEATRVKQQALATRIWEWAELGLREERSALALIAFLEAEGFTIERGPSGMPTAFIASWGSGAPVLAFLSEYDALPELSQVAEPRLEARVAGAGGHGCGHNLFGVASAAAGVALKAAMQAQRLGGTVRIYGTPAEEQGLGKTFLVRDGRFDDVDACLSWHPAHRNAVLVQASKALRSFEITFHGRAAHASAAPWEGVSALDGLEAFCAGVNLLREHFPETARVHYVITEGGAAPNIVPARARLWGFVRADDWKEQDKVFRHVAAIAEGADRMAWGEEYGDAQRGFRACEIDVLSGLYEYNVNRALAARMHRAFELVGAPAYSESEQEFGKNLQRAFGLSPKGYPTDVLPFDPQAPPIPGGSTDVANVSWVTPTADVSVATWPFGVPAHSWASTAASGAPGGYRAMHTAAQVLALTAAELLEDPDALREMREELQRARERFDYGPPVPKEATPRLPWHERGGVKK